MAIFTGAGVAIITPFHADGSINYEKLEELIDYHCNNGTDSIVICGTTGESATMTKKNIWTVLKRQLISQKEEFRLSRERDQTVQEQQLNCQKRQQSMGQMDYWLSLHIIIKQHRLD